MCAGGKRELSFAWVVSFCTFPVTDVLALVRCHFVDTEPRRLRLQSQKKERKISTPPLEALRLIISDAAPARRTICAELPEDGRDEGDGVGLLLQSLYGTRDASANFQEEIKKVLTKAGVQERQVQLQHEQPREGGHKGNHSWR